MSVALEFLGPLAGAVIGKGGATLKGIEASSGCKLQLSQALAERYLPSGLPNAAFATSYRTVRVSHGRGDAAALVRACEELVRVLRAEARRKYGQAEGGVKMVVTNGAARMLTAEGGGGSPLQRIRAASGASIEMEPRGGETNDWRVVCLGSAAQALAAVGAITEATVGRETSRHQGFLAQWTFDTEYSDHFETPRRAYADVLPLLEVVAARSSLAQLVVYDPYYCQGRVKQLLRELGCLNVVNANRDFYADIAAARVPSHDCLLTNPPYSAEHKQKLLAYIVAEQRAYWGGAAAEGGGGREPAPTKRRRTQARAGGALPKPFLLLMPAWAAKSEYWRAFLRQLAALRQSVVAAEDGEEGGALERAVGEEGGALERAAGVFYACPTTGTYQFEHPQATQRSACPFFSVWFCGGWAVDGDRRAAIKALKCAQGVEVLRSTKKLRRRGHFEAVAITGVLGTGVLAPVTVDEAGAAVDAPSAPGDAAKRKKRDGACAAVDAPSATGDAAKRKKRGEAPEERKARKLRKKAKKASK